MKREHSDSLCADIDKILDGQGDVTESGREVSIQLARANAYRQLKILAFRPVVEIIHVLEHETATPDGAALATGKLEAIIADMSRLGCMPARRPAEVIPVRYNDPIRMEDVRMRTTFTNLGRGRIENHDFVGMGELMQLESAADAQFIGQEVQILAFNAAATRDDLFQMANQLPPKTIDMFEMFRG